jgi:hypothetical protein
MGPLTDFASAVDPKPKGPDAKGKGADRGQQGQQVGGSTADKRQLAAAVKTSVQKLATQQPTQRATGQQVGCLVANSPAKGCSRHVHPLHKSRHMHRFLMQRMLCLQVQVLPKASDEVLQEPSAARIMRLYSQPAALVFASSHMLATACAVTGMST